MHTRYWTGVKLFTKKFHSSCIRLNATVIDGKSIANTILNELRLETQEWVLKGNRPPHLVAVLVGQNPASKIYVSNKMKAAKVVGIETKTMKFSASTSENELLACIKCLNHDENVDGILVQLPLPDHITERTLCNAVAPHKDVDGFNIVNIGRFCLDMQCLGPCTPLGVHELIRRTGISTLGKNAVVCGRSKNVGMPIAMLLHADNAGETSAMDATTTICHRYTPPDQLALFTKTADIIVSAAGAAIIDVGITRVEDPKTSKSYLVGDVDFEKVKEVAGYITPVPGGVGPMTVAMLMHNTIAAAKKTVIYNILDPGAVIYKQASQLKP
ncbi:PREDICTED: bifunctional methylenetetrahydrofolate dehydrogenase/cyclohydrolase, mitochondrial isoform X2 [Diuraphis noxia]|uniref:bifunctional methylenetetrahydrofolate dehydrogenase/cyclohydrolase, mitochondrial isoform X2 n=1 Tax=Diuraphis noxia TaxID=143948 RepID=UPI0007639E63|nr:PREDICTED: bifunctional methylenetetrahydrofolate dehydrogenase/cyclohydrolase, mitochondrial isoform X2 [Diuraphis noxia]